MRIQEFNHPSIDFTTFRVFDDAGTQIGVFVPQGREWRANKMLRGMPTAQRICATREEAEAFASSPFGKFA